ncbi:flavin monoamine oxidase family protein [Roseobacter weihaiensis]|uniref:flavin monoamine oxidase family protein n=1 Tax=Roseobacter weihaiensis TaxID=2763262 RepID=UPI001D0B5369|nr:flavin monoamine oxidase family protein [Roseobacter sp. H9]
MRRPHVFDCIVVGAGFAGLSAAQTLAKGHNVLVLEARDRVGGRTEAGTLAGEVIDLGGMWVGPTQTALLELGRAFGVETYPTYLEGRSIGRFDGLNTVFDGEAFETRIGLISKIHLGLLVHKLDRLCARIDPATPWMSSGAAQLDAMTVAQWSGVHVRNGRVRKLFHFIVRSVFCCEPDDLSLLFFLFYLKSAGGLEVLIKAGPGGAQNHLFVGSLHQIAQHLAGELPHPVKMGCPVDRIDQQDAMVTVRTKSGQTHKARRVIVATPPAQTNAIAFSPVQPLPRRALLKRQVMGACIKVWLAYERPFWRDSGLNGSVVDTSQAFAPVFDVTPPGTLHGFLAGFFDAQAAIEWGDATPEDRRAEAVHTVTEAFGPQAARPIDVVERNWMDETYSSGCYGAYMPPGTLTKYGPYLRQPFGRVHWAGTETSEIWSGYVEGAIRSGRRAADEVIAAFGDNRQPELGAECR